MRPTTEFYEIRETRNTWWALLSLFPDGSSDACTELGGSDWLCRVHSEALANGVFRSFGHDLISKEGSVTWASGSTCMPELFGCNSKQSPSEGMGPG